MAVLTILLVIIGGAQGIELSKYHGRTYIAQSCTAVFGNCYGGPADRPNKNVTLIYKDGQARLTLPLLDCSAEPHEGLTVISESEAIGCGNWAWGCVCEEVRQGNDIWKVKTYLPTRCDNSSCTSDIRTKYSLQSCPWEVTTFDADILANKMRMSFVIKEPPSCGVIAAENVTVQYTDGQFDVCSILPFTKSCLLNLIPPVFTWKVEDGKIALGKIGDSRQRMGKVV